MRNSATILTTIALGAMLVLGTATASMARGGGGHSGSGAGHASAHSSMSSSASRSADGAAEQANRSFSESPESRGGNSRYDDPEQSSPYYHSIHNSFLSGLFRR
jgi:hypothetical protein